MAGLKELARKHKDRAELNLEDVLKVSKSMADSDADSDTGLALRYKFADVRAVHSLHSNVDFSTMLEQINQSCEQKVIYAIKTATERFVTIGGSAENPMVIIDMLTREYRVLYGFGEERQGYHLALIKQGFKPAFKPNTKLYLRNEQGSNAISYYNPRFDASILFRR